MQFKHASKSEEIVLQKLESFLPIFLDLEPNIDKQKKRMNSDLIRLSSIYRSTIDKFLMAKYQFEFKIVYACRSSRKLSNSFIDISKDLKQICKSQLGNSSAEFYFLGAQEIYEAATAPTHSRKELRVPPGGQITNESSYIALVKLEDFLTFISDEGKIDETMFEFNVRDFEGDTKPVNAGIATTIKEPNKSSNFWWYNNGITVITTKISPQQTNLIVHDPMIVNGLQTANVIYANKSAIAGKSDDDRRILMKIICIDEDELRDGVIKATNSQTRISALALRATDEFQRQIENFLLTKGYFYERRKNFYKNRKEASAAIIDMQRLGQAVMTLNLHVPDQARARPGTYLNKEENYKKVFPKGTNLSRYSVAAGLERAVDAWIKKNRSNYDSLYRNNLRFHALLVLAFHLMGNVSKKTEEIKVKSVTDSQIKSAFEWTIKLYDSNGGDDDNLSKTSDFTKTLVKDWKKR